MSHISGEGSAIRVVDTIKVIHAEILRIDKSDDKNIFHCLDVNNNAHFEYLAFPEIQAWEGALINFINPSLSVEDRDLFIQHCETLFVLEPDFLIDSSAIAECFLDRTSNPNLYFLQRCLPKPSSESMVSGILVNQLLDAYLEESEPDFQTVFKNTLVFNIFTALYIGSEGLKSLRRQVKLEHLPVILKVTEIWKDKPKTLEPSFISIEYGLQGRLDVFLDEKDIVELKSSKARDTDVWTNHRMQVVCYHLLLRSVYGENRQGHNYILYSRSQTNPLREVPTLSEWEQQVISIRNAIVEKIHRIAFHKDSLLHLNLDNFGEYQIFKKADLIEFQGLVKELSPIEYIYIDKYLQFLFKELWQTKVGNPSHQNQKGHGFSALWKLPKSAKRDDFAILENLIFQSIDNNHVTFTMNSDREITNFREGDIIVLYPGVEDEQIILKDQIRKGFILELTQTSLVLQMRNIPNLEKILTHYESWAIEHDFMESNSINMIRSMFNFMRGEKRKRNLILGISEPKAGIIKKNENDEIELIMNKAMASQDYFLLQGPPGTGKTSKVLTSLVSRILKQTNEQIMILAFTNRAVDEICERLGQNSIDFLRLGNGNNPKYHYLPKVIADMNFIEIEELVSSSRVYVATVSTFLNQYQELFRIKTFDTLFVDEASQLLEPHLAGILIHFKRFILIGDQNQLPAVVTQNEDELLSDDAHLSSLEFHDLHQSLFERLYRRCVTQKWVHAYDMLTNHYRMHNDIQDLVNHFYQNRLRIGSERQTTTLSQHVDVGNKIEDILQNGRVIFIAVNASTDFKRSAGEAKVIASLLEKIYDIYGSSFDKMKVGVITTWRAQINEIVARVKDENLIKQVTVDTVERFQGSERDIIIFSTAVSSSDQLQIIQSLSSDYNVDRKLNVAISRAREQFILLGDPKLLMQSHHYRKVIEIIKAKHGYYNENLELVVE
jgi:DNA replication ATP-dependent helicase Dna2